MRDTASRTVAWTWALVWPWSNEAHTASAKVRSWGSVGANSGMRWWRAVMAVWTEAVVYSIRTPGAGLAGAAVVAVVAGVVAAVVAGAVDGVALTVVGVVDATV